MIRKASVALIKIKAWTQRISPLDKIKHAAASS
jgi:hypothetical protein